MQTASGGEVGGGGTDVSMTVQHNVTNDMAPAGLTWNANRSKGSRTRLKYTGCNSPNWRIHAYNKQNNSMRHGCTDTHDGTYLGEV